MPVTLAGPRFRRLVAGILGEGKCLRFTALGHSMHPTIRHGDTLTLAPMSQCRPRWGAVVAVVSDVATERVVVHRVIRLDAATVTTQGDALPRVDGTFPRVALLGVVTRIERNGRPVGLLCALWPFIPPPVRRCGLRLWRGLRRRLRTGERAV